MRLAALAPVHMQDDIPALRALMGDVAERNAARLTSEPRCRVLQSLFDEEMTVLGVEADAEPI